MTLNLVTGGSGYFGEALIEALRARGESVRSFDQRDSPTRPADVELIRGDIRDPDSVRAAVDGVARVFHNVAQVPLARDRDLLRSVNVDGTATLLAMARDAGVQKVVHTSSSAVFGIPERNPVEPSTVPRPQDPYGAAKLAAEWCCLQAATEGFDVSIVRPRTILGHGRLGIFGILFDWISDGASPVVLGGGTNRYQFVHSADLASACIAAGERSGPGVYNIGSQDVQTMATTLQHLCEHAGTGATVRSMPTRLAKLAMRISADLGLSPLAPYHWLMYGESMWFDIEPAQIELGWTPTRSTDEMFAESYDWFVAHKNSIPNAHTTGDRDGSEPASHHRMNTRQGVLSVAKVVSRVLPPID